MDRLFRNRNSHSSGERSNRHPSQPDLGLPAIPSDSYHSFPSFPQRGSGDEGKGRLNATDNSSGGRPQASKGFFQSVREKFTGGSQEASETRGANFLLTARSRSDRIDASQTPSSGHVPESHREDTGPSRFMMSEGFSGAQVLREVNTRAIPTEHERYAGNLAEREQQPELERQAQRREDRTRREAESAAIMEQGSSRKRRWPGQVYAVCIACRESFGTEEMVRLECSHWYCFEDLSAGIESALKSRQIFECCRREVPEDLARKAGVLAENVLQDYELLVEERKTKDPIYCSNGHCASFIPPIASIFGNPSLTCAKCESKTCKYCRKVAHGTTNCVFEPDQEAQELRKKGYRECPGCHAMVTKTEGCDDMRCRCGTYFCYRCGTGYPCLCWGPGRVRLVN